MILMNERGEFDNINLDSFTLLHWYFDHQSDLHGINHTYRVMYHCIRLGEATNLTAPAKLAFMAAFIHDMARRHDGYCTAHGAWAAEIKLPLFSNLFREAGASKAEIKLIYSAVFNHSLPAELDVNDPAAELSAILKDADALDRIRLGNNNLRPECLRFRESLALIEPAKNLFHKCRVQPFDSFGELLSISG
jgi:HD superfamily phosphodiesterase